MDVPAGIDANCKEKQGTFVPVIDRNRCEGKAQCVTVCPYNVFTVEVLPKEERSRLTLKGKMKGLAHGWRQALTPNADACHACGLCVASCPEKAISLART